MDEATGRPDQLQEDLIEALGDLVTFLRLYGETRWADWFAQDRQLIVHGDRYGATHALRAYGGMGSFRDVMIDPANGHPVAPADVDEVNETLSRLRSRVSELATRVVREG